MNGWTEVMKIIIYNENNLWAVLLHSGSFSSIFPAFLFDDEFPMQVKQVSDVIQKNKKAQSFLDF